ncbi:MAG TPA: YHS domain-containing (seleno)protein [Xanthobacteraceae bacterium]
MVDPKTGLAISGFDPVAYFTDAQALPGKGELEQAFAGTIWRFRSAGNRAAFMADPQVYMPRFGGYDPVGVARGVAVPGNPRLWLITAQRLYLFYAAETQQEFANDGDRVISIADSEWERVKLKIDP